MFTPFRWLEENPISHVATHIIHIFCYSGDCRITPIVSRDPSCYTVIDNAFAHPPCWYRSKQARCLIASVSVNSVEIAYSCTHSFVTRNLRIFQSSKGKYISVPKNRQVSSLTIASLEFSCCQQVCFNLLNIKSALEVSSTWTVLWSSYVISRKRFINQRCGNSFTKCVQISRKKLSRVSYFEQLNKKRGFHNFSFGIKRKPCILFTPSLSCALKVATHRVIQF